MDRYLIHAVGMFDNFKHYHISFTEYCDYVDLITLGDWSTIARNKIEEKVQTSVNDVYIVGYNKFD